MNMARIVALEASLMARQSWHLLLPMGFCGVGSVLEVLAPALSYVNLWLGVCVASGTVFLLDRCLEQWRRQ